MYALVGTVQISFQWIYIVCYLALSHLTSSLIILRRLPNI